MAFVLSNFVRFQIAATGFVCFGKAVFKYFNEILSLIAA